MAGSFVAFTAGILNSFRGVTFFMVLDDHPILKLIFKKYGVEIQNFFIGTFHFELLEALSDMCVYRVRFDNFSMTMSFFGIDADSRDCRSNVDFVHFMWHN
jgi:hypothetical protein